MNFAENNQISQRQLYRQIVIAFIAPLILCLFENRKTLGLGGLAGTAAALAAVLFYVIFLIRLRYAFARPCKTAGVVLGRLAALFFLIYCILGAAFLLNLHPSSDPDSEKRRLPWSPSASGHLGQYSASFHSVSPALCSAKLRCSCCPSCQMPGPLRLPMHRFGN